MRYAFNAAPMWVDDIAGFSLVAIVMLAAAQTLRRGEHIGVDLLTERICRRPAGAGRRPGRRSRPRRSPACWSSTAGRSAMLRAQLGMLTEGSLEWPTWWLMLLLPLGGALLAARRGRSASGAPLGRPAGADCGADSDRARRRMTIALILLGLAAAALHRPADLRRPGAVRRRAALRHAGRARLGDRGHLRRAQPLPAGRDPAVRLHGARHDPRRGSSTISTTPPTR